MPAFDPDGPPDPRRWALERSLSCGLVETDSGGAVVPAAASTLAVSADSLVYTFRLRPELAYVDGSPCRSQDFALALKAGLARADHSTRLWQLAAVTGAERVRAGRPLPALGIETPDDRTLVVRLAVADPLFLRKLAIPGTGWAWKRREARGWSDAVGLGPFRVWAGDTASRLVLVRSGDSLAGRGVTADTLTLRFLPGAARVRSLLRAGRPEIVWPLPPGLLAETLPPGYRVVARAAVPARRLVLVMRADLPPTTRLAARRALGHGVNRSAVLRALGPAAGGVEAWIPGAPPFDFPRLDQQAIEMWRERGKLGRSFHVVMVYDANGVAAEVARVLQGEWATHSIYVELLPLTGRRLRAEFLAPTRSHLVLGDLGDLLDAPAGVLASLFMPLRGPAVGGIRAGWRTREFDAWILPRRSLVPFDPVPAQRRLEEEGVILPIARLPWLWVERAGGPAAPFRPDRGPDCPPPP